jgi:creatinine amidohydrolase
VPLIRIAAALGVTWLFTVAGLAAEIETERMTWVDIRDAVAAGKTTIIIPTGGTEQNGPHMVTGKHNFVVRETARRIAAELGDALVAPVLAYVPEGDIAKREGHMAYPGTISVPPDVFMGVLEAAAQSFAAHGFRNIVLLGDSGPNQAPQQVVAADLSRRWAADGVRVMNAGTYYAANGGAEMLKSEGESDVTIGTHAAIRDTSELMAVFPEGVHLERAVVDKDGVAGDPARATALRGVKLLDLKILAALEEIKGARKAPISKSETAGPGANRSFLARLWHWFFG